MATTSGHTIKAFDEDLDRLRALISQMGGLAEHAIRESMRCLVQRDLEGAQKIVENDKKLDALEIETERRAVQLHRAARADGGRPARRRRRAQDFERGRADRRLCQEHRQARAAARECRQRSSRLSLMPEMARIATEMVHDVLTAFVERDAEAAVRVCERDRAVDDFYNSIFRTLLTFMMENPGNISQSTHLLFIAKNIERVGDHATNIAEMVYYAATGQHLADRPRGADSLKA